jgi:hypothetical protein
MMKKFLVFSLLCLLSVAVFIAAYPAITAKAADDYPPPPPLTFTATLPVIFTPIFIPRGGINIPKSPFSIPQSTVLLPPETVREVPGYMYVIIFCAMAIIIFSSVYYLFLRQSRKRAWLITR